MALGVLGRRAAAAVMLCCVGMVSSAGAGAAAAPAALREPAVLSRKALGAATLAVARAGARVVAVGERGTVLLSDDAGRTWRQSAVPVQTTLTAVRFIDAKTGWATGHMGVILRSDDAGQTWRKQLDGVQAAAAVLDEARAGPRGDALLQRAERFAAEGPDKPFLDIAVAPDGRGWAVGAYGLIVSTEDGGATWRSMRGRLDNPMGLHLYAVRLQGRSITVAGEQGFIARSDDGGQTFTPLASPYKGSYFGLLAPRQGGGLLYGLRGNVYRSADGTSAWHKAESTVSLGLSAGIELADGRLVLLAQNGDLLVSRDGGERFERREAARPVPAAALVQVDDALIVAGLHGVQRVPLP